MPTYFRSARGFTLIEAVLVILILSITAAIAFPTMNSWLTRIQERSEVRSVIAAFHQARGEAARRNCNVVVKFFDGGAPADHGFSLIAADQAAPLRKVHFKALRIKENKFGDDDGGFDFRGMPAGRDYGSVTLQSSDNREYSIAMTSFGRVKLK